MKLDRARQIAAQWRRRPTTQWRRADLDGEPGALLAIDDELVRQLEYSATLRRGIAHLQAELDTLRARATMGGVYPGYHEPGAWTSRVHEEPSSANDPDAPPLHRSLVAGPPDWRLHYTVSGHRGTRTVELPPDPEE